MQKYIAFNNSFYRIVTRLSGNAMHKANVFRDNVLWYEGEKEYNNEIEALEKTEREFLEWSSDYITS